MMASELLGKARFPATMHGVADAAHWVREMADGRAFSDELAYALELCLEELATNVARHGRGTEVPYDDEPAQPLTLDVSLVADDKTVELSIEDNARPFDVSRAEGRPVRRPLSEVLPGGLGIQLVRSFSDELLYEPADGGNRVIVKFLRQPESMSKAAE